MYFAYSFHTDILGSKMNYRDNPYTEILHKHPHQECTRCVMDTSDPWISFDDSGLCSHCQGYDQFVAASSSTADRDEKLKNLVEQLKKNGRGKDYDCVMGLSGGVDSSYLAWYAVEKMGLRPLVIHVDTGWNSELAVNNIQNIVQRLNLDMHTLVIDWDEIKDLQQAYLRAGIANLDVAQDHSFIASLYREAKKYNIRDVLNGGNMQTESILPNAWGYDASDEVNLKDIHRHFGQRKLKNYPIIGSLERLLYYPIIRRMRVHRPLELMDYNKAEAKKLLMEKLGWRDYGGKHYESVFTKFFQAHYLPQKFGYDKRKAHLASLIVSGQMTKEQAKDELAQELYDPKELEEDKIFFTKKLGIPLDEFDAIMKAKPSSYSDFKNNEAFYARLRKHLGFLGKVYRKFR